MSESDTKATPIQTDIAVQDFAGLVAQYHHRLLSLEAELKDCARSGRMPTAIFSRRVKRLKKVHAALGALQRLCIADSSQKSPQSDIGLPNLNDCTPEELAVVEQFLAEREREIFDLEEQTSKVQHWLSEALLGKAGALKTTLRLSKLRALIQGYEKRTHAATDEMHALTTYCETLVTKSAAKGDSQKLERGTLECLAELFHGLDGTIQRVARLKAALKKEEAKTQTVAAWLHEQESLISQKRPNLLPPTPLATTQALRRLPLLMAQAMDRTKRRKDLVERFWEDVLHPSSKDVAAASSPSFRSKAV